jgi:hypothetical protein
MLTPILPLIELLADHELPAEGAVVIAKPPFTWGCDAAIVGITPDGGLPEEAVPQGFEYFLGFEEIQDLIAQAQRKRCSDETRIEFLCHYATCDAYPMWFNDLPDA